MTTHTPPPGAASSPSPAAAGPPKPPGADGPGSLAQVLLDVEALIPCDRALIWLLDEQGQVLSTAVGRQGGKDWNPGWTRPANWPGFAPALDEHEFVMVPREDLPGIDETDGDPDHHARHFLLGPILDDERAIGLLSLSRTDDRPFTEIDLQTLRSIAGLASIAVRASIAIEREREQRRRVMQMGVLTAALNQARTPRSVAESLLRGVARLAGAEHASIALISPTNRNRADIVLSEPLRTGGTEDVPGVDPREGAVEAELLRTRRHISGPRLRELLDTHPAARPEGMHGLAALPIRNGTQLDGVLYLWSTVAPDDPAFAELPVTTIDTVEALCAQAAVALERTGLQQLAQQAAREQRALADFSSRLATSMTCEEMASAALRTMASILTIAEGRVTLVESGEGDTGVLASFPDDDAITASTCHAVQLLERWVRVGTTGWSGPLATWMEGETREAQVLCWPLASDEGPIGTLTVLRHGSEPFAPHELELASHTCGQLALGLQRVRSHTAAIVARDEAERNADLISRMLRISNEMSRQHDLDGVLRVMDEGLASLVDCSLLEVYTADEDQEHLDLIYFRSMDSRQPAARRMPYGSGPVGRAARMRRPAQGSRVGAGGRMRVLGVPMVIEGALLGVIALGRDSGESFTQQELSLLGIFSAHAASELSRADLARQNRELYLGGIRALTSTVDAKDPHTRGHSARVGRMARLIAEAMGLPREDVERVELAGLLHDVGKIGIPDTILQKPGPLDQEERAIMMGHAEMGATILREAGSDVLESLVPLVLHHHEWWDGRGYPGSLRGDDIPVGAQIISVADAYDTMTNDRPYRRRSSVAEAWRELLAGSGTQFSPTVVEATAPVVARFDRGEDVIGDLPGPAGAPLAQTGGQLGDLRALGILVGLARITSHMTDLGSLIEQVLTMMSERLDMSVALILGHGEGRDGAVEAYCQTSAGFQVFPCPNQACLDAILAADLPASLGSITAATDLRLPKDLFRSANNTGVAPLVTQDELAGALLFEPSAPDRYWRSDLGVIETVAPHVTAAVNVARMHHQAKADANTDGLTGALNYRAFQRELASVIARDEPFAVMMFDVVGLKPINDTIGHLAGDQLLRHSAAVIGLSLAPGDLVARIGGDEFGALLTGDDAASPEAAGERIVARMERDVSAAYRHTVTLRYGWSAYPVDGRTPDLLLHVADQRMYLNRPSGRGPR